MSNTRIGLAILLLISLLTKVANAQCIPDFSFSPDSACAGTVVNFTDQSKGVNLDYVWQYGDSTINDTIASPSHTFQTSGKGLDSFEVKLVISNNLTCKDSITKTIYVDPNPQSNFQINPDDTLCSPAIINFNNQSIGDSLSYYWNFGDSTAGTANTDSSENPNFTYSNDSDSLQQYRVELITEDTSGCLDTTWDTAYVQPSPKARFNKDSIVECGQDTIKFNDTSKGKNLSYQWNFGDPASLSNTSKKVNPEHFYSSSGDYEVTLEVTNNFDCVDSLIDTVDISPIPNAQFTYSNPCKGLKTDFKDQSSVKNDSLKSWQWDFGDGNTANKQNPDHQYNATGSYQVQLITKTNANCQDTATDSITVHPKPSASISDTSLCEGNSVSLSGSFSGNVSEYLWDYDDGQIEKNNKNPFHLYSKNKNYLPRFQVTFADSSKCSVNTDTLRIIELPRIQFSVTTPDTQCFDGNQLCLKDSTDFYSSVSIKNRTVLFGDGNKTFDNSNGIKTFCHQYSQSEVSYDVQLKATNQEGCKNSKVKSNAIRIREKWQASFQTNYNTQCFGTPVNFNNQTTIDSTEAKDFKWDFGDGDTDTNNWDNFTHTYDTNGAFKATLTVTGKYGCTKKGTVNPAGENVSFTFDVSSNKDTFCFSSNNVEYSQTPVNNANFEWDYGDGVTETNLTTGWTTTHRYRNPGRYLTSLNINKGGCDTTYKYDTVWVIGVKPILDDPINQFQCEIDTPVVFVDSNTQPYQSKHYGVPNVQRLWDFGDTTAPSCTTNTTLGIDTGKNCRYSRDSIFVSHQYPADKPDCYTTTLTFKDTSSGCQSSATIDAALQEPEAGPDSSESPSLIGASFTAGSFCLGPEPNKSVNINLNETQPQCLTDKFWVMWDSACARKSGNFSSKWQEEDFSHNYDYDDKTCDTNGYRTIGLVIKNGEDSNENTCYDTAWYTDEIRHNDFDPRFTHNFKPSKDRCPPVTVTFELKDTTRQDSINTYEWKMGDDTTITRSNPDPLTYTFKDHKNNNVKLTLKGSDGCQGNDKAIIPVGFDLDLKASPLQICKGEKVEFRDTVKYWTSKTEYWRKSNRPETLNWDFGDGKGFSDTNYLPSYTYDTIGDYTVRLAAKDSSGCTDTLTKKDFISVYGINAHFSTGNSALICTPEVNFKDTSTLTDPGTSFSGHPNDSAASWEWQFGDGKGKSFVKEPTHNYTQNDTFDVKLKVTNTKGCQDSINKSLQIKGPKPNFSIKSNAKGCPKLTTIFDNKSKDATSYIWEFGDKNNNVLSTKKDTNIDFTYQEGGSKSIFLVAQDSVKNPNTGSQEFCSATYPDTSVKSKITVDVKEKPQPEFTFNTFCDTTSVSFQDNSTPPSSGSITKRNWEFGKMGVDSGTNPSFDFKSSGEYKVKLITKTNNGCKDSITKNVLVPFGVNADFSYQNNCKNEPVQFTDSSTADSTSIQSWEWRFGDGATSSQENPNHSYTSTGSYTVELIATSKKGCKDTIQKTITIYSDPVSAFSVGNTCEGQDVDIQNNSTIGSGSLSYSWDFGDGTTGVGKNPKKVYSATGNYTIELVATSNNGCKDTTRQSVTINATPQSQYSVKNTCLDSTADFSNNSTISSGTINSYDWEFGDGNTSSATNPSHKYASEGNYASSLVTTSDLGCQDTASKQVTIHPEPNAAMSFSNACEKDTVNFKDQSSIASGTLNQNWDFGDGSTSGKANPKKVYSSDGSYNVELIITSGKGCEDTATQTITIHPRSNPGFILSNQCKNDTVNFTDKTTFSGVSLNYQWEFGDGKTSTKKSPKHVYKTAKTFSPQLTTTTNKGCKDSISKNVIIHPLPKMAFNFSDGCENENISFKNQTTISSGNLSHQWDFGNGQSSTKKSPTISYSSSGTYSVELISTSNKGCEDTLTQNVTIHPRSDPAFTFSNACEGDTVRFTNNSTVSSGSLTYKWEFGDGDSSKAKNPEKVYNNDNTYTVKLEVTTDKGCTDSLSKSIDIHPRAKPAYTFSNDCEGNAIDFNNNTTVNSGSLSYTWDFDDGTTSSKTNPSHIFSQDKNYNVELKAITDKGCEDSITKKVKPFPRPEAKFTFTNACLNKPHQFTNNSTIASGSLSYKWEFGDNTTSTKKDPGHTYPKAKKYTVELKATSNKGCEDSINKTVETYPKPNADFGFTNKCFPEFIPFKDQSTVSKGSITDLLYKFGDGNQTKATNPQHQYSSYGDYSVDLVATTNYGCKDTVTKKVTSYAKPDARFTAQTVCYPKPTPFNDQSTLARGNLTQWNWQFGDNSQSNKQNPVHQYPEGGQYDPELVVTTDKNCKDTLTKPVTVHPQPKPGFAFNDTCLNQPTQFQDTSSIKSGNIQSRNWELGDGTSESGLSFTHVYPATGQFQTQLLTTSDKGCKDSIKQTITVDHLPKAGFTHDTVCYGFSTSFNDTSSVKKASLSRWEWKFGDGDSSKNQNPKHAYPGGGNYQTRLVVESNLGCLDTVKSQAEVFHKPKADFSANEVCYPNATQFTDQSSVTKSQLIEWDWQFDDGDTSQKTNPQHAYSDHGIYSPILEVESDKGCLDTIQKDIIVHAKPKAQFQFGDTCQPFPVNFRNRSTVDTGSITQNDWQFGDNNISSKLSPNHRYASYGQYQTQLIVTTNEQCKDTLQKTVETFPKPEANFSTKNVCLVDTAVFRDSSTVAEGTVQRWNWDFDDGDTAIQFNPAHQYQKADSYDVREIVTTNNGCKDTATRSLVIYPMPQVAFSVNDSIQCLESNNFQFGNNSTIKWGTMDFLWRTETGDSAQNLNFAKTFEDYGDFTVTLEATSNNNCFASARKTMQVYPDPKANFKVNDGCTNDDIRFLDFSSTAKGRLTDWHYQFGDDSSSNIPNPAHIYPERGKYTIREIVTNNAGCDDTTRETIQIYGKPGKASIKRVTVVDDKFNRVEWTPVTYGNPGIYNIYRSKSKDELGEKVASFKKKFQYDDYNVLVDSQPYYYHLRFKDSCKNPYPYESFAKSVHLDVQIPRRYPKLFFNKYLGWQENGVDRYEIQWSDSAFGGFQKVGESFSPIFIDKQTRKLSGRYCYRVIAQRDGLDSVVSVSNVDCINSETNVYVPDAFSPNGDGINDKFRIKGSFVMEYNLRIYNRWGELVFESNKQENAWDGTYKGERVPTGIYIYVLSIKGTNESRIKKGNLKLIR